MTLRALAVIAAFGAAALVVATVCFNDVYPLYALVTNIIEVILMM